MDDYISRKAAINAICRDWCNRDYCGDCFFHGAKQAIDVLKALPDADVVEVVRCKDCKSFSHGYCKFHDAKFVREDGYCYWGELKDGEQGEQHDNYTGKI